MMRSLRPRISRPRTNESRKVAIWTPDKDLAQCVRDTRVVQIDGRRKTIRDAAGIREKVRRRSAAHSGPARTRGRCGRRLPRHPWDRREDCRSAFEPLWSRSKAFRRTFLANGAISRSSSQEPRDPAHRCATLRDCRDAALARCDVGVRGVGGAHEAPRLLERCEKAAGL